MTIRNSKIERNSWNRFVLENSGSFLQSWEWGEFQESAGRRVFRFEDNDWQAQFMETKVPIINKKYWYCPRGPIMGRGVRGQEFRSKIEEIISRAKEAASKNTIFFRFGPEWEIRQGIEKNLENLGFKKLHYDIEPSQTLILDMVKSEEELLAQMHEKWRYNIRLAERKGVVIKNYQYPIPNDQFEKFYELVSQGTAERKKIKHHPKEYYRKQLLIGGKNPPRPSFKKEGDSSLYKREVGRDFESILFTAEYENKIIAANIVAIFGQRATYLHGATSSEHREVMAPHLLQWEQIKYAKNQGCSEYDFWGIVNEHTLDKRSKSWEGFTRFKKGFGGREVNYIGYWDYPMDKKWYFLYRLVQKFRR